MAEDKSVPAFNLPSESVDFTSKKNDIFGSLEVIEQKHQAHEKARRSSDEDLWKKDPDDNEIVGHGKEERRDSNSKGCYQPRYSQDFKRPIRPPAKRFRSQSPDYKVHPEKWKQYSLEDVSKEDMSERSNSQAAFAFLEERRKLRESLENPECTKAANIDENACSKGLIAFTRKSKDKSSTKQVQAVDAESRGVTPTDPAGLSFSEPSNDLSDEKSSVDTNASESDKQTESVSFKSRKSGKRNIRSRQKDDDSDD